MSHAVQNAAALARELGLGIFGRVFPVQPAGSLADTIHGLGFHTVQLNLVALGHPTVPDAQQLAAIDLREIGGRFARAEVQVWGLSATYNMAHPDPSVRARLSDDTANLISRAGELGAAAVTLCTGTRDPDNQWRAHPDNTTPQAWDDMMASFATLVPAAAAAGIQLAVEPEPANVIAGTDAAVRLVEALGEQARHVGFILDPANLVAVHDPDDYSAVLRDAFTRLGDRTICMQAKDVVDWHDRLDGATGLDFAEVFALHAALPRPVPVIIQDTAPDDVPAVRDLLLGSAALARS